MISFGVFMGILKSTVIKFFLIQLFLISLSYQSVQAAEQDKYENTYLNVARTQLNIAFENYNKGNIAASKKNLKHASEWLYKAVEHSQSDIVKVEAKKLAVEIDRFRSTLNKSSGKNGMARFWHQVTSLIKRESEHLIYNYTETLTHNRILKYLLDAKMHYSTADHDLFISHNSNDAKLELSKSLEYLVQAESLAKPESKLFVKNLIISIKELISRSELNKSAWKQDALIHSLNNAINNLSEAESVASRSDRLRVELIKKSISKLKKDTLKTSLKTKYESIMVDFSRAINNI